MGIYEGVNKHFSAMIVLSVVVVIVSCASAVHAAGDEEHSTMVGNRSSNNSGGSSVDAHVLNQLVAVEEGDEEEDQNPTCAVSKHGMGANAEVSTNTSDPFQQSMGRGEKMLCAVQAMGWIGICSQSFFWTAWRGERVLSFACCLQMFGSRDKAELNCIERACVLQHECTSNHTT
jgi:hypothetical protein